MTVARSMSSGRRGDDRVLTVEREKYRQERAGRRCERLKIVTVWPETARRASKACPPGQRDENERHDVIQRYGRSAHPDACQVPSGDRGYATDWAAGAAASSFAAVGGIVTTAA